VPRCRSSEEIPPFGKFNVIIVSQLSHRDENAFHKRLKYALRWNSKLKAEIFKK
jgi:hypothetical protein